MSVLGVAISLFLLWASDASDTAEAIDSRLAAWRADIDRLAPAYDTVTVNTENYRALLKMGANVLPHVVRLMQEETNPGVLYCYESLFEPCGHFRPYLYSIGPEKVGPYDIRDEDQAGRPLLSRQIGEPYVTTAQQGERQRDIYLQWWDQRGTFLERDHAVDRIREIVGRDHLAFRAYGFTQYRLLAKEFLAYGIYNFPCFIDVIAEDDNPIILYHFGSPDLGSDALTMPHPRKQEEVFNAVQAVYPTRDSKVRLICDWWAERKNTFTELADLYQAIDARVIKLEEELKAKQKP